MIGDSLLYTVLVLTLLAVLLWFVLGTQRNIRRGNDLLRWLQTGLPLLGRRTALRWLGSSAAQLTIRHAREPFREAEVVVVLEPRDVSVLWAWARARRRRDFLILRGWLTRAPSFELEAGNPGGWTGGERFRRPGPEDVDVSEWPGAVRVRHSPQADTEMVRDFWERLADASGGVWRVSIRREPPHVEAHVLPPPPESGGADRLLEVFRELGARLVV